MKKVFLLESDPLMLKAWETQLENSSWELYVLDSIEDFSFRVKDFSANLIVVSDNILNFKSNQVTDIPLFLLTQSEDPLSAPFVGRLKKPLDICDLEEKLDELLSKIS